MAERITDKKKKKIIADYTNVQNYSEVARMNNGSDKSVKRIIEKEENSEMVKKVEEKKEENTKDILEYMDSIYDKQKNIIDLSQIAYFIKRIVYIKMNGLLHIMKMNTLISKKKNNNEYKRIFN